MKSIVLHNLKESTFQQRELGTHSIPKGYRCNGWTEVQNMWETQSLHSKKKCHWGKESLTAVPSYIHSCWKLRNDIIHGNSEKSKSQIKQETIIHAIEHLHTLKRAKFNDREKKFSNYQLHKGWRGVLNLTCYGL